MAKTTKPMTKGEIIDAVATIATVTKADAERVYNAILEVTAKQAKKADFTLPGLGKFSIVKRAARTGRNPQTGETMKIPAKKALKFTLSKIIKDKVIG